LPPEQEVARSNRAGPTLEDLPRRYFGVAGISLRCPSARVLGAVEAASWRLLDRGRSGGIHLGAPAALVTRKAGALLVERISDEAEPALVSLASW